MSLWAILTEPVSLAFLVAALAVLALSLATRPRQIDADALAAAWMLLAAWAFSKGVAALTDWPTARAFYPVTDLIQALAVIYLCENRETRWKLALLGLLGAKLLVEIGFRNGYDIPRDALYLYRIALDALYAAELIVVASSGGRIVADAVTGWLLRGSRLRHDAVFRAPRPDH